MTEWGIDTLFNPGKRHMDDEKRRLQATREDVGDSSGGRRIDLESGAVVIARRAATPGTDASGDTQAGAAVDDPQSETTQDGQPAEAGAHQQPSDATEDGQPEPGDSGASPTPMTAYERARARRHRG